MINPDFQTIQIDTSAFPESLRGGIVAIGNFDGFHRGHRAVVDATLAKAREMDCPAIILTFSPHPRTWFNPENPVYILTPEPLKSELAEQLGFAAMAVHVFNKDFSSLSAQQFIDDILLEKLGAKHIVTGHDFHFGSKRTGTPEFMREASERQRFGLTQIDPYHDENSEIISSSRIRDLLAAGEISQANGLLGYTYQIRGTIIPGQKIGRTLGFPTANMLPGADVLLQHGIYAVRAIRTNGDAHDGVASFGRRPTFDNGQALFETYIFDFDRDIYGEELNVLLYSFLREEMKFDSAEALVAQMKLDKQEAIQFLTMVAPNHLRWPQRDHA